MLGSAPEHFQASLNLFDPLLAVRAGKALQNKWVIERKAYISQDELYYLQRRRDRAFRSASRQLDAVKRAKTYDLACQIAEEFDCAQRGKRVICFVDNLDRRVFDMLVAGDLQRYGGFSRWITELEEQEIRQEKELSRQFSNENEARSKEVYDKLNFIWDHRESKLLQGVRSMKELLK